MGIFNYFTVSKDDDGSTYISTLGTTMSFEQVSAGVFLISSGRNSQLWFADYGVDGKAQAINADTYDLLRASFVEYVIDLLSIGLLIVCIALLKLRYPI